MKNLLDKRWRETIETRLDKLAFDAPTLWGRMNVDQMVCHVTDPMRIALGQLEAKDVSTVMTRTVMKWAVLGGMPPPKGKVQTFAEIDQVAGRGTLPTTLAEDVAALKNVIAQFVARDAKGEHFTPSPAFGTLSNRSYGRLQYVHLHYHLRQFGA